MGVVGLIGAFVLTSCRDILLYFGLPLDFVGSVYCLALLIVTLMSWYYTFDSIETFRRNWYGTPCPKCRRRGHHETIDGFSVSSETTGSETQRTTHCDAQGNKTGYSEREVEFPATSYSSSQRKRCAACDATWWESGRGW